MCNGQNVMICSSCETLFCSQFNLVFSNLEFVCLSVRESWLVANKGGRMDIRIMYCVKQNLRPPTEFWNERGNNFCRNIKRCLWSIISRWLSICVQSFVHKTCQLYGLLHCPVQHNAIFVPVCVCLRMFVLSSCVSVSLGLCVFVSLLCVLATTYGTWPLL